MGGASAGLWLIKNYDSPAPHSSVHTNSGHLPSDRERGYRTQDTFPLISQDGHGMGILIT